MGQLRKGGRLTNVGGKIDAQIASRFLNLARTQGVSMIEALRRVMVDAILQNRIPGIDTLNLENREAEKYGREVVGTYDGQEEATQPKPKGEQSTVAPRAQ